MLKNAVTGLLHRFGYELFHHSKLMPGDMAAHMRSVVREFEIDCVIDVGANVGQFAHFLRNMVGFDGLLVSLEPVAEVHAVLAAKASQDKNWLTLNCAAGEENADKVFNVMQSSELSSFMSPDTSDTTLFESYNSVARRETVRMRTIDSVIGELREKYPARRVYLKVDTQGYDMQVFEGARGVWNDVLAIQTEAAFQRLYADMPRYLDTLAALDGRGFDLSGVFPIQLDSRLRLIEADCIFVNRAEALKKTPKLLQVPGLTHVS